MRCAGGRGELIVTRKVDGLVALLEPTRRLVWEMGKGIVNVGGRRMVEGGEL